MARLSRSQAGGHHRRQRGSLSGGAFAIAAGATLLVALAVVVNLLIGSRHAHSPAHGLADRRPPSTATPTTAPLPHPPTGVTQPVDQHWLRVLRTLDAHRQTAWRLGRPELLARVYAPGSAVLRADRGILRTYLHRGLRVSRVSLQFGSVMVERRDANSVRLVVVDRLRPAFAVDDRDLRQALPRDRPTRHRIDLRLVGHTWRIARVALV